MECDHPNFKDWHQSDFPEWKREFTLIDEKNRKAECGINPYDFFSAFSEKLEKNDCVFLDTGCSLPWFMQSLSSRVNYDIFHDCNNTAMGWSIPAAIGEIGEGQR